MTIGCPLYSERKDYAKANDGISKRIRTNNQSEYLLAIVFHNRNEQRRIQNHSHHQDTDIIDYVQRKGA
jgi:hypothetical protein